MLPRCALALQLIFLIATLPAADVHWYRLESQSNAIWSCVGWASIEQQELPDGRLRQVSQYVGMDGTTSMIDDTTTDASGKILVQVMTRKTNGDVVATFEARLADGTYMLTTKSLAAGTMTTSMPDNGKKIGDWVILRKVQGPQGTVSYEDWTFGEGDSFTEEKATLVSKGAATVDVEGTSHTCHQVVSTIVTAGKEHVSEIDTDIDGIVLFLGADDFRMNMITKEALDDLKAGVDRRALTRDSLNEITSLYFSLLEAQDFDAVEHTLLNDIDLAKVPEDILPYFRDCLELSVQGRMAMEKQGLVKATGESARTSAVVKGTIGAGAIALYDPVSAALAVVDSANALGTATDQEKAQLAEIAGEHRGAIQQKLFELSKLGSSKVGTRGIRAEDLVTEQDLRDIQAASRLETEQRMSRLQLKQSKCPTYAPIDYLLMQIAFNGAPGLDLNALYEGVVAKRNSILKKDPTTLNAVDMFCGQTVYALLCKSAPDRGSSIDLIESNANGGLAMDPENTVLRMYRGLSHYLRAFPITSVPLAPLAKDQVEEQMRQAAPDLEAFNRLPTGCVPFIRALYFTALSAYDTARYSDDDFRNWIRDAFKLGLAKRSVVRQCLMYGITSARQKILDEELRPKYTWSITWGVFNDDIVLTNASPFPLSGCVADVDILLKSNKSVVKHFTLPVVPTLAPSESHTFSNCMSISSGSNDTHTGTLALHVDD